MAILSKGQTFTNLGSVTTTKLHSLVDSAAFVSGASGTTDDSSLEVNGSGRLQIKDSGVTAGKLGASAVTTAKIADATSTTDGVTFPKLRQIANMRVIGNVSGSTGAPAEVSILDEDDMTSNSATAIPTQQSVKAYADAAPAAQMTPTAYAGEESVTFPNGFIMKFGTVTISANSNQTVTFGTAFPTSCLNVQVSYNSTAEESQNTSATITSAAAILIRNSAGSSRSIFWTALGY
jgi:hypothetical protein